ncbi:C40 family peptidase [Planosporangium thailandense]|uniref:C40 family peptidase n=1 Tax=Planosporangium thailandense TaxID=765197 RepID=A0ABX0XRR9_9ACTN|nr:C40 family peptidase [Planosporangium thailandense]
MPDAGSRPVAGGALQPPGTSPNGTEVATGGTAAAAPQVAEPGPRGQEILTQSIALETVGQQLRKYDSDLAAAQETVEATHAAWTRATDDLAVLRDQVGQEAGEAYKAAAALGPLDRFATDLHQLSVLAPGLGQQPGGQATARELERAEANERAALAAYQTAADRANQLTGTRDSAKADYDKRNATLTALRTENAAAYQQELAALDTQQAALGAGLNIGTAVKGMDANPKAKRALQHALDKLGSPYVWGAEGPTTFDCSGLVLWSYTRPDVGANLPRVANDQYYATRSKEVPVDSLLPGDLLFFATDKSDWRTVHHVAIYVGNGKMVHAPTTGDVVKVSPVWWSEFYKATRVFDAVPAPGTSPTPSPRPTPPPAPSPSPTPTPSPSGSRSPSPTPSPSGSPSPSPSPSDPPSPSPSPTPSPSDSASSPAPAKNPPPNSTPADPTGSTSLSPTPKPSSSPSTTASAPTTTSKSASAPTSATASASRSTGTSPTGSNAARP